MSVYACLLLAFAVSFVISIIFITKGYRPVAFLVLVPLTWAIVIATPLGPGLLDLAPTKTKSTSQRSVWEQFRYELDKRDFGKEKAGKFEAERKKEAEMNTIKSAKKRGDVRASSWAPFWLSIALAVIWTAFAPLYAVFSVVGQLRSNTSARENNDFLRWTLGILVVYLLFKLKWLRGDDNSPLRRSVEYFGLHVFYNWLLSK